MISFEIGWYHKLQSDLSQRILGDEVRVDVVLQVEVGWVSVADRDDQDDEDEDEVTRYLLSDLPVPGLEPGF